MSKSTPAPAGWMDYWRARAELAETRVKALETKIGEVHAVGLPPIEIHGDAVALKDAVDRAEAAEARVQELEAEVAAAIILANERATLIDELERLAADNKAAWSLHDAELDCFREEIARLKALIREVDENWITQPLILRAKLRDAGRE